MLKQVSNNNPVISDYLGETLAINHNSKARAILVQLLNNESIHKTDTKPIALKLVQF